MKSYLHAFAMGCLLLLSANAALAENDYTAIGIDDPALVPLFIADLQKAVAEDDREAVAAMITYPIVSSVDGEDVEIQDEAGFVELYDRIMTPELKDGIAAQGVEDVDIFHNNRGVMIGDGMIWAMGENGAVRIFILTSTP